MTLTTHGMNHPLARTTRIAVILVLGIALISCAGEGTEDASGDLPQWPQYGFDKSASGQSPYVGPHTNTLKWTHDIEGIGSSAVIGRDGTIYVGAGSNLVAINPDGSRKWTVTMPHLELEVSEWARENLPAEELQEYEREAELLADDPEFAGQVPGVALTNENIIYVAQTLLAQQFAVEIPLFNTDSDRHLLALDSDGTEQWRFSVGDRDIVTQIAVDDEGVAYFGVTESSTFSKCALLAVASDGMEKWSVQFPEDRFISSPALANDGTVYIGGDRELRAIDRENGRVKWSYEVATLCNTYGVAVGDDGTVYVPGRESLHAINPDGTLKWEMFVGLMELTPAIANDGTIYIHTSVPSEPEEPVPELAPGFHAINPDGSTQWSLEGLIRWPEGYSSGNGGQPGGSDSAPTIGADGVIYFGSEGGIFYAVDPTGALLWQLSFPPEQDNRPAIDSQGTLYLCTTGPVGGPDESDSCFAVADP